MPITRTFSIERHNADVTSICWLDQLHLVIGLESGHILLYDTEGMQLAERTLSTSSVQKLVAQQNGGSWHIWALFLDGSIANVSVFIFTAFLISF